MPVEADALVCRSMLIVEDDESIRDGLKKLFQRNGFKVETACDGERALEVLDAVRPDIAVVDLIMPGIDGLAVSRHIKKNPQTRHTKIIILTGYLTKEIMSEAAHAGVDKCIAKPMDKHGLLLEVMEVLGDNQKCRQKL